MTHTAERAFFARPPQLVAPDLLGATLTSTIGGTLVAVRITEVEAYADTDPASHSFRGRTPRNATMFGEPGHLYVYFTYGMHFCANVVSHPPGRSGGVLLRAGEITSGHEVARARRGDRPRAAELARGPACLAQALGITREQDGADLCSDDSGVHLAPSPRPVGDVACGPRVGVSRAADVAWRFWIAGEPSVSAYKRNSRASADTLRGGDCAPVRGTDEA